MGQRRYLIRNRTSVDTLPDPLKVVYEGYDAHLLFYVQARNYEFNKERIRLTNFSGVSPGDTILISQQQVIDSLEKKFNYGILSSHEPVKLVKIFDK